ncbi:MAG: hypothetical protein Q9174_006084, partial [Haloplaca sp. 1 TL-2023]
KEHQRIESARPMAGQSGLTLLMRVLEQEKELFWQANATLPEDEIQKRWAVETSRIRSHCGTDGTISRTRTNTTDATPRHAPLPSNVVPMRRGASDHSAAPNMDRSQNLSQLSTDLTRKRTKDSGNGSSPFSHTSGAVSPLALTNFDTNTDEPFSNYTIHKKRRTSHGRLPTQLQVTDEDPEDYLSKIMETDHSPSTGGVHQPQHSQASPLSHSQHGYLSTHPPYSQSPTTSSPTDLTNATTFSSSAMSRQNSRKERSVCGGLEMMRLGSQRSRVSSSFGSSYPNSQSAMMYKAKNDSALPGPAEDSLLRFTGGMNPEVEQQSLLAPPLSTSPFFLSTFERDASMQRTTSAESNASSQSRVSSQGALPSSRPIAAKPNSPTAPAMSRSVSSEHQMIRVRSADGSYQDKMAIAKAPYVRPQHQKVLCPHCNKKPDGYRGDHELGRHVNKEHSTMRSVWVCIDRSPGQTFLSQCKACQRGKRYNAYYNAAAHLRRAHFNPKPKGHKGRKGQAATEEKTKRAGISGGEQPPMDICKQWMKELHELAPQHMPQHDDDEEDEDDNSATDPTNAYGSLPISQQVPRTSQSVSFDYNSPATYTMPIQNATFPSTGNNMFPPSLSLSAPTPQISSIDTSSFYLNPPTQPPTSSEEVIDFADPFFQMSPLVEDPAYANGYRNVQFQ